MNKCTLISATFLLFVFGLSCKGQNKTNFPQDISNQPLIYNPAKSLPNLLEYDPYFSETKSVTTSHGPGSITRNIIQDRNGNFWLATWEGIIRYDGKNFTNVTNKEGLRRFRVFSAIEDTKGNLWFGTIGAGVYRYDGKSFTNFTTNDGLVNDRIGCILEDKSGKIWFGTAGGVSCYDGKSFRNFTTTDGLANNDVNSIIEDKTGAFWFGTRGEASKYDGKIFTKISNNEGAFFKNVRSLIIDKKDNIWLGGSDGLWRFDGNTFVNLKTNFSGYIFEDRKGNIWTSAEGDNTGIWLLSKYEEKSLNEGSISSQIWKENGMLFGILEDNEGGIWFGTLNGVCRYHENNINFFKSTIPKE